MPETASQPDPIHASLRPGPAGLWTYCISADRGCWTGCVNSLEEARAVVTAAVRGIIRTRRLYAIKHHAQSEAQRNNDAARKASENADLLRRAMGLRGRNGQT